MEESETNYLSLCYSDALLVFSAYNSFYVFFLHLILMVFRLSLLPFLHTFGFGTCIHIHTHGFAPNQQRSFFGLVLVYVTLCLALGLAWFRVYGVSSLFAFDLD